LNIADNFSRSDNKNEGERADNKTKMKSEFRFFFCVYSRKITNKQPDLTSLAKSDKVDKTENKEEFFFDFNGICDSLILTLRRWTAYFVADNFEPFDKTLCA
jgi:hypothetical protein